MLRSSRSHAYKEFPVLGGMPAGGAVQARGKEEEEEEEEKEEEEEEEEEEEGRRARER